MANTGGPLNRLINYWGINQTRRSISVMKLLAFHSEIKTDSQLENSLYEHAKEKCTLCNQKAKGTLEDWAQALFEKTQADVPTGWNNTDQVFTAEDCLDYVRNLFIKAPLMGQKREQDAREILQAEHDHLHFAQATEEQDVRYAVDICIQEKTTCNIVGGIQVKPISCWRYKEAIQQNLNKHSKWDYPVVFMKYQGRRWVNLDDVTKFIQNLSATRDSKYKVEDLRVPLDIRISSNEDLLDCDSEGLSI